MVNLNTNEVDRVAVLFFFKCSLLGVQVFNLLDYITGNFEKSEIANK